MNDKKSTGSSDTGLLLPCSSGTDETCMKSHEETAEVNASVIQVKNDSEKDGYSEDPPPGEDDLVNDKPNGGINRTDGDLVDDGNDRLKDPAIPCKETAKTQPIDTGSPTPPVGKVEPEKKKGKVPGVKPDSIKSPPVSGVQSSIESKECDGSQSEPSSNAADNKKDKPGDINKEPCKELKGPKNVDKQVDLKTPDQESKKEDKQKSVDENNVSTHQKYSQKKKEKRDVDRDHEKGEHRDKNENRSTSISINKETPNETGASKQPQNKTPGISLTLTSTPSSTVEKSPLVLENKSTKSKCTSSQSSTQKVITTSISSSKVENPKSSSTVPASVDTGTSEKKIEKSPAITTKILPTSSKSVRVSPITPVGSKEAKLSSASKTPKASSSATSSSSHSKTLPAKNIKYAPFMKPTDTSIESARKRLKTALEQTRILREAFTNRVYEKYRVVLRPVPATMDHIIQETKNDPKNTYKQYLEKMSMVKAEKEEEKAESMRLNQELHEANSAGEVASFLGGLTGVENADQLLWFNAGLSLVILPEEDVDEAKLEERGIFYRGPLDPETGGRVGGISSAAATAASVMLDRVRKGDELRMNRKRRRDSGFSKNDDLLKPGQPAKKFNFSPLAVYQGENDAILKKSPVLKSNNRESKMNAMRIESELRKAPGSSEKSSKSKAPPSAANLLSLYPDAEGIGMDGYISASGSALINQGVGSSIPSKSNGKIAPYYQRFRHPYPQSKGARSAAYGMPNSQSQKKTTGTVPSQELSGSMMFSPQALRLPPVPTPNERRNKEPVDCVAKNIVGSNKHAVNAVRSIMRQFINEDGDDQDNQPKNDEKDTTERQKEAIGTASQNKTRTLKRHITEISLVNNIKKSQSTVDSHQSVTPTIKPPTSLQRRIPADDSICPNLTISVLHALGLLVETPLVNDLTVSKKEAAISKTDNLDISKQDDSITQSFLGKRGISSYFLGDDLDSLTVPKVSENSEINEACVGESSSTKLSSKLSEKSTQNPFSSSYVPSLRGGGEPNLNPHEEKEQDDVSDLVTDPESNRLAYALPLRHTSHTLPLSRPSSAAQSISSQTSHLAHQQHLQAQRQNNELLSSPQNAHLAHQQQLHVQRQNNEILQAAVLRNDLALLHSQSPQSMLNHNYPIVRPETLQPGLYPSQSNPSNARTIAASTRIQERLHLNSLQQASVALDPRLVQSPPDMNDYFQTPTAPGYNAGHASEWGTLGVPHNLLSSQSPLNPSSMNLTPSQSALLNLSLREKTAILLAREQQLQAQAQVAAAHRNVAAIANGATDLSNLAQPKVAFIQKASEAQNSPLIDDINRASALDPSISSLIRSAPHSRKQKKRLHQSKAFKHNNAFGDILTASNDKSDEERRPASASASASAWPSLKRSPEKLAPKRPASVDTSLLSKTVRPTKKPLLEIAPITLERTTKLSNANKPITKPHRSIPGQKNNEKETNPVSTVCASNGDTGGNKAGSECCDKASCENVPKKIASENPPKVSENLESNGKTPSSTSSKKEAKDKAPKDNVRDTQNDNKKAEIKKKTKEEIKTDSTQKAQCDQKSLKSDNVTTKNVKIKEIPTIEAIVSPETAKDEGQPTSPLSTATTGMRCVIPSRPNEISKEEADLVLSSCFHLVVPTNSSKQNIEEGKARALLQYLIDVGIAIPVPKNLVMNPLKEKLNALSCKSINTSGNIFGNVTLGDMISSIINVWLWKHHQDAFEKAFSKSGRIDVDPDCKWLINAAIESSMKALTTQNLKFLSPSVLGKGKGASVNAAMSESQTSIHVVRIASSISEQLMRSFHISEQMDHIIPNLSECAAKLDNARMDALRARSQERVLLAALVSRRTKMSETFSHAYTSSMIRAGEALGYEDLCDLVQDEGTMTSTILPFDILSDDTGAWEDPCRPYQGFISGLGGDELIKRAHARALIQKSLKRLQDRHGLGGGTPNAGCYSDTRQSELNLPRSGSFNKGDGVMSPVPRASPSSRGGLKRRGSISIAPDTSGLPTNISAAAANALFNPNHYSTPFLWDSSDRENMPYGRYDGSSAVPRSGVDSRLNLLGGRVGTKRARLSSPQTNLNSAASEIRTADDRVNLRSTHEIEWSDVARMFKPAMIFERSSSKLVADSHTPSKGKGASTKAGSTSIFAPICHKLESNGSSTSADAKLPPNFSEIPSDASDTSDDDEDLSDEKFLQNHQNVLDSMKEKFDAMMSVREEYQDRSRQRSGGR